MTGETMAEAVKGENFSAWLDEQERAAHEAIEKTHGQARARLYADDSPAKKKKADAKDGRHRD